MTDLDALLVDLERPTGYDPRAGERKRAAAAIRELREEVGIMGRDQREGDQVHRELHERYTKVCHEAVAYKAERDALRAKLDGVIKAWSAVDEGKDYSPSEIERWLRHHMKAAIDKAKGETS